MGHFKSLAFTVFDLIFGPLLRASAKSLSRRSYPVRDLQVIELVAQSARQQSAKYIIENLNCALVFETRKELWLHCLDSAHHKIDNVIEFGVYRGRSINFFSSHLPKAKIYGFDSFEGLSTDWSGTGMRAGSMSTAGVMPKVGKNVTLIRGHIETTLPYFLESNPNLSFDLVHLDLDIYTATYFALIQIYDNLKIGSIVIFDQYFGYPGWEKHEFLAWRKLASSHEIKYEYVAYTNAQVAIRILEL